MVGEVRGGWRNWRRWRRGGLKAAAAAAAWRTATSAVYNGEDPVVRARSGGSCRGGGTVACGGGGGSGGVGGGGCGDDGGWTPSPAFREQPLKMEETPFFSQMTARVCGGGPFPSYIAPPNGPREERAHLRPTTHT